MRVNVVAYIQVILLDCVQLLKTGLMVLKFIEVEASGEKGRDYEDDYVKGDCANCPQSLQPCLKTNVPQVQQKDLFAEGGIFETENITAHQDQIFRLIVVLRVFQIARALILERFFKVLLEG